MDPLEVQGEGAAVLLNPVVLMYAFRYALGRQSYAVADVANMLIANRESLRPDWREQIIRDIDAAKPNLTVIDMGQWRRVKEAMA